jgi:hypothetical protein
LFVCLSVHASIQDGNKTAYWQVTKGVAGEQVSILESSYKRCQSFHLSASPIAVYSSPRILCRSVVNYRKIIQQVAIGGGTETIASDWVFISVY